MSLIGTLKALRDQSRAAALHAIRRPSVDDSGLRSDSELLDSEQRDQMDHIRRAKPVTCWEKFIDSFNVPKNVEKLIYGRSDGDKNLELLNGIRVLSITWVVWGHSFFYQLKGPI